MNWHLDQADAVDWLLRIAPGRINLMITDPAYESLEKHRAVGTTTRLTKAWFDIFKNERYPAFFEAAHAALAKDAHLYVLCDEETADVIKPIGRTAGFTFWKSIVWDKCKMGMGYHYRNQHEFVLFFEKGKRKLNDLGVPSVLRFDRVVDGYPTEKPIDLLKVLIKQSSNPGELVADPFAGSASTGQASMLLGRCFMGCDVSANAIEIGRRKLEQTPFLARAT